MKPSGPDLMPRIAWFPQIRWAVALAAMSCIGGGAADSLFVGAIGPALRNLPSSPKVLIPFSPDLLKFQPEPRAPDRTGPTPPRANVCPSFRTPSEFRAGCDASRLCRRPRRLGMQRLIQRF